MSVALTYCNSLKPTVYKIGYLGKGYYVPSQPYYEIWKQMLRRCYDFKNQEIKHPSYIECSVHESWLNYQNFGKFCIDNKYSKELFIDKDILLKGNMLMHIKMEELKIKHEFRVRSGEHGWPYWRSGLNDVLKFIGDGFKR